MDSIWLSVSLGAFPQPLLLLSVSLLGLNGPVQLYQKSQIGSWLGCLGVPSRSFLEGAASRSRGKRRKVNGNLCNEETPEAEILWIPISRATVYECELFILCKKLHSQKGKLRPKSRAGTGLYSCRTSISLSFIKAPNGLATPAKVGSKVALKGESMGTEVSKEFVSCSAAPQRCSCEQVMSSLWILISSFLRCNQSQSEIYCDREMKRTPCLAVWSLDFLVKEDFPRRENPEGNMRSPTILFSASSTRLQAGEDCILSTVPWPCSLKYQRVSSQSQCP